MNQTKTKLLVIQTHALIIELSKHDECIIFLRWMDLFSSKLKVVQILV